MATFTEQFRYLVEKFTQRNFFEMVEYCGIHLKKGHFKLGVSVETFFKWHI